ncbi:MAG: hypothetical protein JSU07_11135 [Bacteroidetes bacterium]|nr:hypothetical protein [Bacteroidota bacterium]
MCIIFFLTCATYKATVNPFSKQRGKTNERGLRISIAPAYGFYFINTNHAQGASTRMSALLSLKKEWRLDTKYRSFLLCGFEYFFHGLSFNSYYFNQDTLQIYDKNFAYKYNLFVNEICLPVQYKLCFNNQNNSLTTPYIMFGYHLRYLLPAFLTVTQNGNTIKQDEVNMAFKNPLMLNKMNSAISLVCGFQTNEVNHSTIGFFIELGVRYGFSPYYFKTDYSANSLYTNSVHLILNLGVKF